MQHIEVVESLQFVSVGRRCETNTFMQHTSCSFYRQSRHNSMPFGICGFFFLFRVPHSSMRAWFFFFMAADQTFNPGCQCWQQAGSDSLRYQRVIRGWVSVLKGNVRWDFTEEASVTLWYTLKRLSSVSRPPLKVSGWEDRIQVCMAANPTQLSAASDMLSWSPISCAEPVCGLFTDAFTS